MYDAALSDIRVIDMTRVWAGPLGSRIFADFGAHVIRVSDPRTSEQGLSLMDRELNRNKPNLAVRLDIDEGRDIFLELVAVSDVVVENFRPRVMPNLDLGYETLSKVNPGIVLCSMSGFGATGPYSTYPSLGTAAEAQSGIVSMLGYPGELPLPTGLAYADPLSGLNMVAAVMNALTHKRETGLGQFIDHSLADSPVGVLGEYVAGFSVTGRAPGPSGNRFKEDAPSRAYAASGDDNWVAVSVTSDDDWCALRRAMGDPETLEKPEYATADGRRLHEDAIDAAIAAWMRDRDPREAMERLQAEGVPAGLVAKNRDVLSDPHLSARGLFVELDEPQFGPKRYAGIPIPGNSLDVRQWKPASDIGQDSAALLTELLGYDGDRVARLQSESIVGAHAPSD